MAGVDVVHVPYRGSTPAHMDLVGGQVQAMFDAMTSSIEHIKSGRMRVLGVTAATRLTLLPDESMADMRTVAITDGTTTWKLYPANKLQPPY